MPTPEVTACMERLRGFAEALSSILDTPGQLTLSTAVFLVKELQRAIEDLDNHLRHPNDIKAEAREHVTCWPQDFTDGGDDGGGGKDAA